MTISDRIRKQLEQPDGVTAVALEPLADEFGRETVQVNARLTECVHLLRKGLRSEAIQRAFMKPNILDWSAQLDFPELDEWLDILKFYGITVPTLLDRDAAQQLQEAIVDEQPLEELLRQHRRLAIAQAPLQWRLKVLRTLVKTDSLNPVWREDQVQWETIRLKQIPNELKRAIEAKEILAVRDISTELNNSNWAIKPPADLCKRAASSASSFHFDEQVLQLRSIADRLHAAYSEGNEAAASRHSQAWNDIVRTLSKPLPEDLTHSVEPAMEWLKGCAEERERVERHSAATAALGSSLQQKSPLADIQRAYYDLTSMQMGVDPILEQRYQTSVAELRQTTRRRMQMTFFAVASSAVTLLVLFGLWQWNRTYRLAVSDSVARLTELIVSKNFAEAESLVQKLTSQAPSIVQSPEVGALVSKLQSAQDAESTRSSRVAGLIEEAKQEDASQIDISKVLVAEKDAVTPAEKDAIRRIRLAWEDHERKIREAQFQLANTRIQEFEKRLQEIQQMALNDVSETELNSIVLDLGKIPTEFPKSGVQSSKLLDVAMERAASLLKSVRRQRSELEQRQISMRGIRESTNYQTYESALKRYVDKLPGDSLAIEFIEVIAESGVRNSVATRNGLCKELGASVSGGLSQEKVTKLVKEFKDLETVLKWVPDDGIFVELKELATIMDARTTALDSLVDELNNSVIGELVTIMEQSGTDKGKSMRRFMSYDNRVGNAEAISKLGDSSRISLPVISDALGAVAQENFRGKLVIVDEPRSCIRKIIKRIETNRKAMVADWEPEVLSTIQDLTDNPNLDVRIKELLLVRLLKMARAGSPAVYDSFASLDGKLSDSADNRTVWYLKSNFDSVLDPLMVKLLQTGAKEALLKRDVSKQKLNALANRQLVWVGAMLRDSKGTLEAWFYRDDVPDGTIYTIATITNDKDRGQVIAVGSIRNKKLSFQNTPETALAGRPLFWLRFDQPAKK